MEDTLNNAATNGKDNISVPVSDEEVAALATAAHELLPSVEWVGLELKFVYATGKWFVKTGKDEEEVGATEIFAVDMRSYAAVWKRWAKVQGRSKRSVTDMIGGRRVDGWVNPPRDLMPENAEDKWPLDDDREPEDPWQENSQIVLRRLSDAAPHVERAVQQPARHGRAARRVCPGTWPASRLHAGRAAGARRERQKLLPAAADRGLAAVRRGRLAARQPGKGRAAEGRAASAAREIRAEGRGRRR
jgi:hypothetical protein